MKMVYGHLSPLKANEFLIVLQHTQEMGLGFSMADPQLKAYRGV